MKYATSIYTIFRISVGLLLLLSAASKAFSASGRLPELPSTIMSGVVFVECAWGLCLLLNPHNRTFLGSTVALFFFFSIYNGILVATGTGSCGCFGGFEVPPRLMLLVDLIIVAFGMFLVSVDLGSAVAAIDRCTMRSHYPIVFAFSAVVAVVPLLRNSAQDHDPRAQIGAQLTLISQIDMSDQLRSGTWILAFVRPQCSECYDTVLQFTLGLKDPERQHLVVVELRDGSLIRSQYKSAGMVTAHLDTTELGSPFSTPCVVEIKDGVVTRVFNTNDAAISLR